MLRSDFDFYYKNRDYAAITDYRVDNAILLADTYHETLAPLTDLTPKPLLKVKGEILIERLIRQLKEADITTIYVVVGYKKELFSYLEEKFHVILLENPDYGVASTCASLYAARTCLKNSYICCADIYFMQSIFEPYVYAPFSCVAFSETKNVKPSLQTALNGRIFGMKSGTASNWSSIQPCYWDRAFSHHFLEILEAHYKETETKQTPWNLFCKKHLDILSIRKLADAVFREFYTLEDLCLFDTSYIPYLETLQPRNS